jgi:glycosyltransferase involved in cell wall biosynthesis
MNPLVSVICVCYNHARFITEALESVINQTYTPVELIIVDDGSRDDSAIVIQQWIEKNPAVVFLNLKQNIGYTKAFNKAFALAKGEFYIDLAGDDILLPTRIEKGIQGFLGKGERFAIQFNDANFIDTNGQYLGRHSDKFPHNSIPQGDLYADLIQRYFICSPTMMVRKSVLDALGGYDENLLYEDFDLWVRVGRNHLLFYIPEVLVNRRIVHGSLGQTQYACNSKQLESTFLVCEKILKLNRTAQERRALNKRIFYELKWNLRFLHLPLVWRYLGLLLRNH